MCKDNKLLSDWTSSDVHHRLLNAKTTEEKQACYDEYSQIYDEAAVDMDWKAPAITAEGLWEKIKEYPLTSGQKIRILDVGCGTGLVGERFREMGVFDKLPIHFMGLDFNESMLQFARKRKLYDELVCDDFHKVTFVDGPSDFVIACGVFWQADYGPEALPVVMRFLKEGGYAYITVRRKWFEEKEKGFHEAVEECGCDLVDNKVLPYIGDLVEANFLLLRKRVAE